MESSDPEGRVVISRFTSKDWSGNASLNPLVFGAQVLIFAVLGAIIALVLFIFLSDMRSWTAISIFSLVFGVVFGTIFHRAEVARGKSFLLDCSSRINSSLPVLCGNTAQNISTEKLQELIVSGARHPLAADGVSGLYLVVRKEKEPRNEALGSKHPVKRPVVDRWCIKLGVEPPQYGTESFDRLLESATTNDRLDS